MSTDRPRIEVAVIVEREARPNRWEDWRHRIVDVVPDLPGAGSVPRVLADDGRVRRTLHPGFAVELFRDEAEGYLLNLGSPTPVWFVMWRVDDADASRAWPEIVSVSYNEAGRWLDAQEKVDNVPLPADVRDWLDAFTRANYRPEPKERKRPASFLAPGERDRRRGG
jgi:hypothetical protein